MCNFCPFRCRSSDVRVRVWWRVYPSSHPQGYFPYIVQFRLMFCLRCKPYQLASRAFRSTCVYKIRVLRFRNTSNFKNICPSVCESSRYCQVHSLVVRPFNFICHGHRFLMSTFNWYYSTQSDSHFSCLALLSVVITLRFVSTAIPVRIRQHSDAVPALLISLDTVNVLPFYCLIINVVHRPPQFSLAQWFPTFLACEPNNIFKTILRPTPSL